MQKSDKSSPHISIRHNSTELSGKKDVEKTVEWSPIYLFIIGRCQTIHKQSKNMIAYGIYASNKSGWNQKFTDFKLAFSSQFPIVDNFAACSIHMY